MNRNTPALERGELPNPTPIIILLICIVLYALYGCNATKNTTLNKATTTINDTVRVTTYDTSKHTIEQTEYKNKVVEIYDTVYNKKDSLMVILKTRTIYETKTQFIDKKENGIGKDSFRIITKIKEVIKWKEKETKRSPLTMWIIIGAVAIAAIFFFLIYKRSK